MRHERYELDVPLAVAIGDAHPCESIIDKCVQVGGTFVAQLDLEGTINGNDWELVATCVSPQLVLIPHPFIELRVRCTGYTSGTPTCTLGGFDARTE